MACQIADDGACGVTSGDRSFFLMQAGGVVDQAACQPTLRRVPEQWHGVGSLLGENIFLHGATY